MTEAAREAGAEQSAFTPQELRLLRKQEMAKAVAHFLDRASAHRTGANDEARHLVDLLLFFRAGAKEIERQLLDVLFETHLQGVNFGHEDPDWLRDPKKYAAFNQRLDSLVKTDPNLAWLALTLVSERDSLVRKRQHSIWPNIVP